MMKKVLLTITCGVVAVSMCACASSSLMLEQAQNIVAENASEIESYLPDELSDIITAQVQNEKEEPSAENPVATEAVQEDASVENETKIMLNDTETEAAAEEPEVTETEAAAEEPTTLEEAAAAEEPTTLEETAAAEDPTTLEETTAAEEPETEAGASVMAAEEETKSVADVVEETTAASEETAAATEEETTEEAEEATTEIAAEKETAETEEREEATTAAGPQQTDEFVKEVVVRLEDGKATVDGKEATASSGAVYVSDDITYYQDKDKYTSGNVYGEGSEADKHTAEEAKKNQVLNITEAGTYRISGDWTGQIRVDLGSEARNDKTAKVTLLLDNATVACDVAPAILFKNVYECDAKNFAEAYAAEEYVEKITSADENNKPSEEETTAASPFAKEEETTAASPFAKEEETTAASPFAKEEETTAASPFEDEDRDAGPKGDPHSPFGHERNRGVFAPKEQPTADDDYWDGLYDDYDGQADADDGQAAFEEYAVKAECPELDASDAGAVILIADESENLINGSYVARIYEDSKDRKVLAEEKAAVWASVSMRIDAEKDGDGILNVIGEKAGLGSAHHLVIENGNVNVLAAEDGICACADGISVISIDGGELHLLAGKDGSGEAFTSGGWICMQDGTVVAVSAAEKDAEETAPQKGTLLVNGGHFYLAGQQTGLAAADSKAVTLNLKFTDEMKVDKNIRITDLKDKTVYEVKADEDILLSEQKLDYTELVISAPELKKGESYYLYIDGEQMKNAGTETVTEPEEEIPETKPQDEAAPASEADIKEALEKISEFEDVLNHFGITMKDVEEYLTEDVKEDDTKAENVKENEKQTLTEEFLLTELVTTFTGVQAADAAKDEPKQEKEEETTTAEEETTAVTEEETTAAEEETTTAAEQEEAVTSPAEEKTGSEDFDASFHIPGKTGIINYGTGSRSFMIVEEEPGLDEFDEMNAFYDIIRNRHGADKSPARIR